jgi:protein-tyrosine phosphatase
MSDGAGADDFALRHIPLEACFNFRDVGGYAAADGRRVRWGRLYRAGTLHRMTPADIERTCGLGISTVIDLRRPDEAEAAHAAWLAERGIRHVPLPVLPTGASEVLDERFGRGISPPRYVGYLDWAGPRFAEAIEMLAAPEVYPAVVHCSAGKDRTGTLVALVLDLLGVEHETIVRDYELTNREVERQFRWLLESGRLPEDRRGDPEGFRRDLGVPVEAIEHFLGELRREHGSVEAYVRSQGVSGSTIEGLREQLLEDHGDPGRERPGRAG